jgi:hypothetical protein
VALDLIKEYLVGIGFNVDENSLNKAEESISNADKTIQSFNKNSTKGFSESNDSMGTFFELLKSSSGTLGKLFPELQPFKEVSKEISLIKKLYNDFSNIKKQPAKEEAAPQQENRSQNSNAGNPESRGLSVIPQNTDLLDTSKNLIESILDANSATGELASEGGSAVKLFSSGAVASIGTVVAAITVFVLAAKGLGKFLNELANQDIEYEKLSRQLWTTKENAKEVDMALKTMGATMQDLWLSPTLLKQFNQLRQDSAALKLPKEYTDNLKVVQGIGLEFKRLQQLAQLTFQWIGNYILKYAAEPLNELRETIHEFTDGAIKEIPSIGKVIGSVIGILIRVLAVIIKIGVFVFKLISPIFAIIDLIKELSSIFDNLPEPVKKGLKLIAVSILALASPILLIIGLIDDLMSYFKGGKSLIGSFFDKFGKGTDKLKSQYKSFKDSISNSMNSLTKGWDYYFDKAKKGFDSLTEKAKGAFQKFKEWSEGIWGKAKDKIPGLKTTVDFFVKQSAQNTVPGYTTSNNSSNSVTTANSHNQIKNENTFHVYGGNDSKSTASTIGSNLSGINTRNLQGAFD